MERERIARPDRAGERHRVDYAIVESRAYVAGQESVEMWARFDAEGYLWLDFVTVGFQQGYVEGSNVDPLTELTQMMTAQRTFQSVSSLIESSEGTMQNAIRSLGEPSKS